MRFSIICSLLLSFLAAPILGQQPVTPKRKFDPPRIIAVIRGPDIGSQASEDAFYYINKGQEINLNRGEILNVYREKKLHPSIPRPLRIFIGTMTITESQNGSSVGQFIGNENIKLPIIKYKIPMKGDIVVPRLIIDSGVLFDPGKAALKQGAGQEFDKVANFVINFSPNKIIIEGHTDSDGDDEANQVLSESRAEVVRQYLLTTYAQDITPAMIEARGYGERQPIVANDTPENKQLNRRIEVVVWD
ncbi:MAG: OmpA family protein [Gemmatimonadetes bacterium]|jgi:outer membrane protein OmpA-like peptidoglycan-associated protein|nr:OmpA family protein [Gemmatimonadota bacterium]